MDPTTISDKLFDSPNALAIIRTVSTSLRPMTISEIAIASRVSLSSARRVVLRLVSIELFEKTETLYRTAPAVPAEFWIGCRSLLEPTARSAKR